MAATTRTNIAICFPDFRVDEQLTLSKNSIINTFQTLTECGPAWLWRKEKVLARILEIEGLELLQSAQAHGKGTVVLAPHLGNWEVLGLYLNNTGCGQSSQLYQAPKDKRLDKLIYNARSRSGATMVATDNKGVAMLLKSLKKGEIVGILPDQVPKESAGEYVPLFGKNVLTMTLASKLIQKTGAKCILGVAARVQHGKKSGWKIVFRTVAEQIYAEPISVSLQAMNNSIEQLVREFPEQYQWEYKRYKRVPPDEHRPY